METSWRASLAGVMLATLFLAAPADAAFPGRNGKIAYSHARDIWTVNPGGTGAVQLTNDPAHESTPEWSPDGKQIAFLSTRPDPDPGGCTFCIWEIDVMDADGTDVHAVVVGQHTYDSPTQPAWSPDGTRIAFARGAGSSGLWTIAADGTDERVVPSTVPDCGLGGSDVAHNRVAAWSSDGRRLATDGSVFCDHDEPASCVVTISTGATSCATHGGEWVYQDWSPDSRWVLVGSSGFGFGLFYFEGGNYVELTPGQANDGLEGAAWSPDGTTIVFRRDPYPSSGSPAEVYLIDAADGGNLRPLGGPHVGCCYDWQPIPVSGYPRPVYASPLQVTLAMAYGRCTAPNRTHGPPLENPSCAPPARSSGQLTVGTFDANGRNPNATAKVVLTPILGDPTTSADEADIQLRATATDVRLASDLSDYTGSLEARMSLRITDKDNTPHPGGPGAATVQDIPYTFPVACAATEDATAGSTCAVDTTAEALLPAVAKEKRRAVWAVGQVALHDGAGNAFMRQGVFVP
jgi:Tol biopolymer transport system component